MNSRRFGLLLAAVFLSECTTTSTGGSAQTSFPLPEPTDDLCRCHGNPWTLAWVRIDGGGASFRWDVPSSESSDAPTTVVGVEVLLRVEASLAVRDTPQLFAAGTTGSLRARLIQNYEYRSQHLSTYHAARPDPASIDLSPGRWLFVALRDHTPGLTTAFTRDGAMYFEVLMTLDGAGDSLPQRWFQFPVGTPMRTVLDPSEWNNPARGCAGPCALLPGGYLYGDPTHGDGGVCVDDVGVDCGTAPDAADGA